MKINRQKLLKRLKLAALGLSTRGIIEQSDCFVFADGMITTFNDELMVRVKGLEGFKGAVLAGELVALLEKFPDEEVDLVQDEGDQQMLLTGKKRKAGVPFLTEIHLSVKEVPKPKEWTDLPPEIFGHLQNAARVCGHDETWMVTTCIHVSPTVIEACDNHRLFRARLAKKDHVWGNHSEEFFLPGSSVYSLGSLSPTRVSVGRGWCHFRVEGGIVSVRGAEFEKYPSLEKPAQVKGASITWPEELKSVVARAKIVSEGIGYTTRITVAMKKGCIEVKSMSGRGWFRERLRAEYDGPELVFDVHPDLLVQILARSASVTVSKAKMEAKVGGAQFVIALQK